MTWILEHWLPICFVLTTALNALIVRRAVLSARSMANRYDSLNERIQYAIHFAEKKHGQVAGELRRVTDTFSSLVQEELEDAHARIVERLTPEGLPEEGGTEDTLIRKEE